MKILLNALLLAALLGGGLTYRRLDRASPPLPVPPRPYAGSASPTHPATQKGANAPDDAYYRRKAEATRLHREADQARQRGDIDEAYRLYRDSVEVQNDGLVRLDMAQMLDGARRSREALSEYDALFKDRSSGGTYRTDPTVVARYASLCEADGRIDDAVRLYQGLVGSFKPTPGVTPPQPETAATDDLVSLKTTAKLIEGIGYDGRFAKAKALVCYEEAVRLKPDWALAYLHLAYGRERMHQVKGAEEAYRRALALGDSSVRKIVRQMRPSL